MLSTKFSILSNPVTRRLQNLFSHFSFSSTPDQQPKSELYFNYAFCSLPHIDKLIKGGEDAFYADEEVLAVMDGVGGWNQQGIDPSIYSNSLKQSLETFWKGDKTKYQSNPKQLIIDSEKMNKHIIGSSTLALVTLSPLSQILYASYIGDSGYQLLRMDENKKMQTQYMYKEQTKAFNFPYQIGTNGDNPNKALEFQHEVKEKDIVVIATDGLFDNVDEDQIKAHIQQYINDSGMLDDVKKTVIDLGRKAFELSNDLKYKSPFAKRAKAYGYRCEGGKPDDITIIIGQIKKRN